MPTTYNTVDTKYTFSNWSAGVTTDNTVTYTALYDGEARKYTVSFNKGGGTGDIPTSVSAAYGSTISNPGSLTMTGYSFDGWKVQNSN